MRGYPRRPPARRSLGASTASIVITLTLLSAVSFGGWYGYCDYQAAVRSRKVERSLDAVHRYRGAHRVTRARILASALEKLKAAGGRLEARDLTLRMAALTPDNGRQLPRMLRTKLALTCHMRGLHAARDNRIDRIRRRFGSAGRPRAAAPPAPRPGPAAPPALDGSVGCSAAQLAELDYTYVELTARATVRSGLVRRSVTVTARFFLPQRVGEPNPKESDSDSNDAE